MFESVQNTAIYKWFDEATSFDWLHKTAVYQWFQKAGNVVDGASDLAETFDPLQEKVVIYPEKGKPYAEYVPRPVAVADHLCDAISGPSLDDVVSGIMKKTSEVAETIGGNAVEKVQNAFGINENANLPRNNPGSRNLV